MIRYNSDRSTAFGPGWRARRTFYPYHLRCSLCWEHAVWACYHDSNSAYYCARHWADFVLMETMAQ